MMAGLARCHGVVISGVEAHVVEVEAHLSPGLPGMSIVGLPDTAVAESRDRVRAAVLTSGARWPQQRITVGLSPASLHKSGSGLDAAIASVVLAADGQVPAEALCGVVLFAELALDGRVRPVRGSVLAAVAAVRSGATRIVLAAEGADQAAIVPGIRALGARHLRSWIASMRGEADDGVFEAEAGSASGDERRGRGDWSDAGGEQQVGAAPDLSDVLGQPEAIAALEVAAAGGHHVAMVGRPGVGKTMLAERLPTILPDLDDEDALTVTSIRSVVCDVQGLVRRPPFQAPHHTASVAALVGGGRGGQPTPGAVTLAHGGVLFLDEAAEFGSACLEALRQPLESGSVQIARAGFTVQMPARFQLVMAANPCPCGQGDGAGEACTCRSQDRRRYQGRLSGPLLDRVDIRLTLGSPSRASWTTGSSCTSEEVRARVQAARCRAAARAQQLGVHPQPNSRLGPAQLRTALAPAPQAGELLSAAVRSGRLSARGADRALRVAWSVADLEGAARPGVEHVGRALAWRAVWAGADDA